jgi:hypothetical protein
MQGHNTSRHVITIAAAIVLGLAVGLAPATGAAGAGPAVSADTSVPFWPHETGALAGTSETFVEMRADGSYYDPSLGRRVARAADSTKVTHWRHETGALAGTSETFVDMRADGSYYDPSLGRRVTRAAESRATGPDDRPFYRGTSEVLAPTSVSPDDRPFARHSSDMQLRTVPVEVVRSPGFDWEDGAIGGAFGAALALLGVGAIVIARRHSTLRTA